MTDRYIEITASADTSTRLGIYRNPETDGDPYTILARVSARRDESEYDYAIALKRTAAELSSVFDEVRLSTDEWGATVWRASWYDQTHGTKAT
jgi:hypothetical protein